ncbi:hypothetical protein SK803_40370 [Lentzea sp. BCCO 10_0856]|uniref:Uncharacterized protein n=1 Tax=Lentzea miocenica TaxID=3095431 RepID=A0ABU4TF23_9PSEU|nr:hypothetical protein [Lentzea sp. BCCO 10_0856]MDX8036488.1 hypothetical protein [Lentzea sp. BCCO 10_0856]
MNDELRFALNALSLQGLALKRHILSRLLNSFPAQLTATEVAKGGPHRTDASVRGALKTLDRIGAVQLLSQDETGDVARCRIAPGTQETIRAFLLQEDEESRTLSPLPPRRAYQQVLRAMYEYPEQTFTLKSLLDRVWSERTSVRAPLVELCEAGYLLRGLTDESRHGRPEFTYRLNPNAKDHADALLCAPTCSPRPRS